MSEPITLQDKKQALNLAYHIVTDERNGNRYAFTSLVRKESPEMFTYSDMLRVFNGMHKELEEAPVKQMQKPLTLQELHELIDAGEDVAVYCEGNDDAHAYATIFYNRKVVSMTGTTINAEDLIFERYGITWRVWASRPTDEERAAAPWEK